MQANSFDRDTNDVLLADDLFIADDVCVDYYDWPILAAGCVFSHTLLDALMVQAMYNSNIISFWEALTCTGDKGKCIVNDHQRNVTDGDILDDSCRDGRRKNYQRDSFIANSTKVGSEKTLRSSPISKSISHINQDVAEGGNPIEKGNIGIKIEWRNKGSTSAANEQFIHEFPIHTEADFAVCHKSKESPSSPSSCDILSTGDRNGEVGEEKTEAGSTCPREDSCRSLLDKIVIPPIFVGEAFSVMFTSCFHYNGIIVIALYRLHNEEHASATAERRSEKREYRSKANKRIVKTLLPFVVTAPPMNTILLSTDEIFILRASN